MNPALKAWSLYARATKRWPALGALVPFIPVVALWWIVAAAGFFPRAFFPSPADVIRSFGDLVYKGILPEYLEDSVTRLALGAAAGMAIGIPLGLLVGLSRKAHAACGRRCCSSRRSATSPGCRSSSSGSASALPP